MTSILDVNNSTPDTITSEERIGSGLRIFGSEDAANVFKVISVGNDDFTDDNDFLRGGNFGDQLSSSFGDDTLEGLSGNDILYGEEGNDALRGGADSDNLIAGDGNDTVSGGTGSDLFVFEFFGDAQENTVDFNAEEYDRIYIQGQGFVDTEDLGIGDGEVTVSFDAEGNVSINGEELTDDDFEMI